MKTARKVLAGKTRSRKASRPKQSRKQAAVRPLRRQFQIEMSGAEPLVIDLVENEAITIDIQNNATKFLKASDQATVFRASGHRWSGSDYFILSWGGRALKIGDSVLIRILEGTLKATPPKEEEKYIEPERDCSFCQRKASEVKELLEANLFTRICNECVVACYTKLYGKHAT
jgi:ClpX C4-type zinc finger protein